MLLITGAPACGKSRLAHALGERFGRVCLSKDHFKEVLFERLGESDAAWSRRLSDASFALMFALAARLLAGRQLLLLEGNFRPGEHEAPLRALLAATHAASAQILCVASEATRRERLARRAHDPQRHAGHRDAQIQVGDNGAFLDLPGERWRFDSDADWGSERQRIEQLLRAWEPER